VENYKLNPKERACKIKTLKVITEVKIRGWDRKEQSKETTTKRKNSRNTRQNSKPS